MLVIAGVMVFFAGAILGSFLLTAAERVRQGVTLWGRSACPECQKKITPIHLVPLFSWLALGGRCAGCRKPIAFRYPLVELASGLMLLALFLRFQFSWPADWPRFVFEACFAVGLLFFGYFDYRWRLVPIELTCVATVLAVVGRILISGSWLSVLIGLFSATAFVLLQVILSRGKLVGSGDPWAAAFIGAGLGWPLVAAGFYLAYVVGGLFLVLLWALGLVHRGDRIPLVSLLAGGAFAALLWSDVLTHWTAFIPG